MEAKRNNSKQRQLILDALRARKDHPTAETLYEALRPENPRLSLGTVYRNLAVLTEQGQAVAVAAVDGRVRYDGRTGPHAHFICRVCHRMDDLRLPDRVTPEYPQLVSELGCLPESYSLCVSGLCADCAKQVFTAAHRQ